MLKYKSEQNNRILYLHTNCMFNSSILTKVTKLDLLDQDFKDASFLAKCVSLRELKLSNYMKLTSLKGVPSSCMTIEIIDCPSITRLQGINACTKLHYLNVRNCPLLRNIIDSAKLPLLYTIFVDNCDLLLEEDVLTQLQQEISTWQREGNDFLRLK